MASTIPIIPPHMWKVYRHLNRWRSAHTGRLPIPDRLWTGAVEVGDLFMSLIHTCELNDVNPFDYLTELQKHAEELAKNPAAWMPWNYRDTLP